jgi:predicted nucleic acid-binding protein
LPEWINVKEPNDKEKVNILRIKNNLHAGESESIALAMEENNVLLVLDDSKARNYAINIGLNVTGTIGIINRARKKELMNIDEAVNTLMAMKEKSLWISDELIDDSIKYMQNEDKKRH